jgi:hypothetical protein
MGYVESKEDPPIQIVRTHQHHTNSTLLQTVKYSKNSLQSKTRRIKDTKSSENEKQVGRKKDSWIIPT